MLGTFTSVPYWFRRLNPFIHILIIYAFTILGQTDFKVLPKSMIGMFVILFTLINLYLNSAFKALLKVVEQSIAKELNSHRRISTMFNSLQEGIVIVQRDHALKEDNMNIIFANEISRIIFSNVLRADTFSNIKETLLQEKMIQRYKRSDMFQQH